MKIALLQTGKTNERHISEGVDKYSSRIKKYAGFEIITVPDIKNTKNMPGSELKQKEGARIIESLLKDDFVVLLDEKGKEYRTVEFSEWMEKKMASSVRRVVFVIGGAWGFSDEVYARADIKMALSKMTFPHQLVRLLFAEQLYRAFTIMKGEPYHHE
jgi:23S rRNA (pseudouridine1915-N3)-methyltransferase